MQQPKVRPGAGWVLESLSSLCPHFLPLRGSSGANSVVPLIDAAEVAVLYRQHTEDTGKITPEALARAYLPRLDPLWLRADD